MKKDKEPVDTLFSETPNPIPAADKPQGSGKDFLKERLGVPTAGRKGRKSKAEEEAELRAKIESEKGTKPQGMSFNHAAIEGTAKFLGGLLAGFFGNDACALTDEEARLYAESTKEALAEVVPPEHAGKVCAWLWGGHTLALFGGKVMLGMSKKKATPQTKVYAPPPANTKTPSENSVMVQGEGLTDAEKIMKEGKPDGFNPTPRSGRKATVFKSR